MRDIIYWRIIVSVLWYNLKIISLIHSYTFSLITFLVSSNDLFLVLLLWYGHVLLNLPKTGEQNELRENEEKVKQLKNLKNSQANLDLVGGWVRWLLNQCYYVLFNRINGRRKFHSSATWRTRDRAVPKLWLWELVIMGTWFLSVLLPGSAFLPDNSGITKVTLKAGQ